MDWCHSHPQIRFLCCSSSRQPSSRGGLWWKLEGAMSIGVYKWRTREYLTPPGQSYCLQLWRRPLCPQRPPLDLELLETQNANIDKMFQPVPNSVSEQQFDRPCDACRMHKLRCLPNNSATYSASSRILRPAMSRS